MQFICIFIYALTVACLLIRAYPGLSGHTRAYPGLSGTIPATPPNLSLGQPSRIYHFPYLRSLRNDLSRPFSAGGPAGAFGRLSPDDAGDAISMHFYIAK